MVAQPAECCWHPRDTLFSPAASGAVASSSQHDWQQHYVGVHARENGRAVHIAAAAIVAASAVDCVDDDKLDMRH